MIKSIILAAGEGTRMKSNKSKVLHTLVNKPMLSYVVEEAKKVSEEIVIVVNEKNKDEVNNIFPDIKTVTQKVGKNYPYGTGYATSIALDEFEDNEGVVIVLSGDVPLLKGETLKSMVEKHENGNNVAMVLSCEMDDPTGYGRIIFEDGKFSKIVEHKDANDEELKVKEINSGIYSFNIASLKDEIKNISVDNAQGELYLTDVIEILSKKDEKIDTFKIPYKNREEIQGINNKLQLAEAENVMRKRINDSYMLEGVILENPETITIEKGVEIGKDTRISQNVTILGDTKIGESCIIKSNSRIEDSILEDNVTVDSSVIESSYMSKESNIGPFSHLRPKAQIGERVHIGNFVEVKNAIIKEGSKAGHLAYIGDADVGKYVNIGCGAIFVNYDGKFKHRSKVEDYGFIGSNANLVAPVIINEGGYVAAGSTITRDVEKGALSIERSEQKNIEGYVEKKKKRDQLKEEESK